MRSASDLVPVREGLAAKGVCIGVWSAFNKGMQDKASALLASVSAWCVTGTHTLARKVLHSDQSGLYGEAAAEGDGGQPGV